MSLFGFFSRKNKDKGEARSATVNAVIRDILPKKEADTLLGLSRNYVELDNYGLIRLAQVIELVCRQIATADCEVRKLNESGRGYTLDRNHKLSKFFRWTVNEQDAMTFKQWVFAVLKNGMFYGNGYGLIERHPLTADPIGLKVLHSPEVKHARTRDNQLVYVVAGTENSGIYLPHQIFHLKGRLHDGIEGEPLCLHKESLDLAKDAQNFGKAYFSRKGNWGGWIEQEIHLDADAADDLAASLEEESKKGAHGVPVLPPGFKFNPNKVNASEAQVIETRKYQDLQIAAIFNIPPAILGMIESGDKNIEAQGTNLWKYALLPWFDELEKELEVKLLRETEKDKYEIRFSLSKILRGDDAARTASMAIKRQWGVMSQNDYFASEDLPLVEGGDEYLRPLNMIEDGRQPATVADLTRALTELRGEIRRGDTPTAPVDAVSNATLAPGRPGGPTNGGEGQGANGPNVTVETFTAVIDAAVDRLLRKEATAIETALRKEGDGFFPWADRFYRDHIGLAATAFAPVLETIAAAGLKVPKAEELAAVYCEQQRKALPTTASLIEAWRSAQQKYLTVMVINLIKGAA